MDYVIVFALGMLAATMLIRWMARRAIDQFMDRIVEAADAKTDQADIRVKLEVDQNIYFLYNNDDGAFIAQGTDLLTLRDNLVKRFPDRTITIVEGDATAIAALTAQIKELNENRNSIRSAP